MIVPITGNVSYSITLDPSVWIFDDRKVLLEEAFIKQVNELDEKEKTDDLKRISERFNREVLDTKMNRPPVNKSISKREGEKILKNSYVMPLHDFITNAEIKPNAKSATLITDNDENVTVTLGDLEDGYFLFSINGKPLKEDGPVHYFYKDGSNKDNPVKNIKKIVIN
ncbi:hypothetical protein [Oceanobacillus rekensis]|uniref:hypothetical protein n=1 Tax=Oceanobacillus rekensis TaxID=937927 RepID=UPI000B4455B3|nr:hypothetical protein [Oceanobacillus rekensis]